MALQFRLREYCDPWRIWKLKYQFDRNQRSASELRRYQSSRLKHILQHAMTHVPHYRELDLTHREDPFQQLAEFPLLTKAELRKDTADFLSETRGRTWSVSSSGTSGESLHLQMDRPANALEFVHYWRYWNGAGYRLGERFAEFSTTTFLEPGLASRISSFSPFTQRLALNSVVLDAERVESLGQCIQEYRPRYIKGLASALYLFAKLSVRPRAGFQSLRGIFSTGEALTPTLRQTIEGFFGVPVWNSYGQMERVAAIVECEQGQAHLLTDYGYPELVPAEGASFRLVATGLHNHAMPLIRYETGDLVEGPLVENPCECGRVFPRVKRVLGRDVAPFIQVARDRWLPAAYVLIDGLSGVEKAQIVQRSESEIEVKVVVSEGAGVTQESIRQTIVSRFAEWTPVSVSFIDPTELYRELKSGKCPPIWSPRNRSSDLGI